MAELRQWKEVNRNGKVTYEGKVYNHLSGHVPDGIDYVIREVVSIIKYKNYMIVSTAFMDIGYGFKLLYDEEIRD